MAQPFSSASVGLEYRPDARHLVIRWPGAVDPESLRVDYTAVLALADQHGCGRWLLDLRRRRPHLDADTLTWLNREFLPLLVGRYPQGLRLAFVLPPRLPDQTDALAAARAAQQAYPVPPGRLQVFADEASAVAWLNR